MADKVAIVGYSGTMNQAPFNDESWDIYGMNYRFDYIPRFTKWFDIHHKNYIIPYPEYVEFLKQNQEDVIIAEPIEWLPNASLYPKDQIIEQFGSYFTNSVSWLICYAIMQGYKEIALYGIDLSTHEEYMKQKPSVLYFLGIAKGMGIKITLPETCHLFTKERLYWLNGKA